MLYLDFETVDPYISAGYGSGWVFAVNHGKTDFKLLGASIKIDDGETYYETDFDAIKKVVMENRCITMHNAAYDMGCTMVLFGGVFDWSEKLIFDTMIMAKLYTQNLLSYSLSSCGEKFGLSVVKNSALLWDYAWDTGLYQNWVKETRNINKSTRPSDAVLDSFCKTHMDLFPVELVAQYANYDVDTTAELFQYLSSKLENIDYNIYSDLIKLCLKIKQAGINIDMVRAKEASTELTALVKAKTEELYEKCGARFNTNSVAQVVEAFKKVGITGFNLTDKGNESIGYGWLEEQDHPVCQLLADIRKTKKIKDSFIDKLIKYQEITGKKDEKLGILYPSFHILGATKTGRFTSGANQASSLEVNMQQIPARDPVLGPICRSLFVPPPGHKWITADYSNQEQRLQVHYAATWRLEGGEAMALEWTKDPHLDYHSQVAKMVNFGCSAKCGECQDCQLGRRYAKTINLGLSYGMGSGKLCKSLGLPTAMWTTPDGNEVEVAGPEGKILLEQYHTLFPFMKKLQETAQSELKARGAITTIGGRRLEAELKQIDPYCRKGLSKLIQGSAADQIIAALINCDKAGLQVRATIHDEICLISCNPEEDVLHLKQCMENTYPTTVPMVAEIGVGNSWGDSK